jgi:RNA polymerase sigma-70 factor (ECF subfamily)
VVATPSPERVSRWLGDARAGKQAALDALFPVVYDELRRVARAHLRRERAGHSLQSTLLVNEAYLRLLNERQVNWQNRAHFCAIAANSMRQILIEHARARRAAKRGGGAERVTITDGMVPSSGTPIDVEALDEALTRLAVLDPRRARIVELKYFGGLGIEEIGRVLDVSPATVKRGWALARAWLRREIHGSDPSRA